MLLRVFDQKGQAEIAQKNTLINWFGNLMSVVIRVWWICSGYDVFFPW